MYSRITLHGYVLDQVCQIDLYKEEILPVTLTCMCDASISTNIKLCNYKG